MTLAELRELLGRATERPWFDAGEGHVGGTECVRGNDGWPEPMPTPVADSTEADAALIAAAVNALPALLDAVEAAKKMLDESCMARDDGDHTKDDWIVHHKDRAAFDAAVARLNGA